MTDETIEIDVEGQVRATFEIDADEWDEMSVAERTQKAKEAWSAEPWTDDADYLDDGPHNWYASDGSAFEMGGEREEADDA